MRGKFAGLDTSGPTWFADLCARAVGWTFSKDDDAYMNEMALKTLAVEIADLACQ